MADGSRKDHQFEFDIYLAYVIDDIKFVKTNLIKRLDKAYEGCYRCCFEHRNFAGGAAIIDCVVEAIQNSYVTILVLSKNAINKGFISDCTIDFISKHMLTSNEALSKRLKPIKIDNCEVSFVRYLI